jgi:hypothetical protein
VKPVGAMPKGSAAVRPNISVLRSTTATMRKMPARNSRSIKGLAGPPKCFSASAAPSAYFKPEQATGLAVRDDRSFGLRIGGAARTRHQLLDEGGTLKGLGDRLTGRETGGVK